MNNFIIDLDNYYIKKRKAEKILNENNLYTVYLPLTFEFGKIKNKKFIIRKKDTKKGRGEEKKTQFIFTHCDARAYFTDYDILKMLMSIDNEDVLSKIVENFKLLYSGSGSLYNMFINKKKYVIKGIEVPPHSQMLQNKKDIPMEYEDLMILIILVLAKDQAKDQAEEETTEIKSYKRTLAKYISLLEWYRFNNDYAKQYLDNIQFPWDETIDINFDTAEKAKSLHKLFPKEEIFESSGLL